jgi:hypothetical protein
MNKHTKLLIMKAGGIICSTEGSAVIDKIDYLHFDAEKFAELIVAECIEVFGKDLPEIDDKNFNILDLTNRICNVADHFGVEE